MTPPAPAATVGRMRPGSAPRRRRRLRGQRRRRLAVLPLAAAAGVAATLSACGGTSAVQARLTPAEVMTVDAASRTVDLHLVAAETSGYGGFNFDGYSNGSLTVRVPSGWTVVVTCHNASTVLTHSCAVLDDVPIAPAGGPLAFPGASTPDPVNGIGCGTTDVFSFVTSVAGRYRIACLVSGHEADGMWDWLVVTGGGAPSLS